MFLIGNTAWLYSIGVGMKRETESANWMNAAQLIFACWAGVFSQGVTGCLEHLYVTASLQGESTSCGSLETED